ncbi:hypothetical protein AB9K32_09570 [Allomuricauda sp. XS_ASV26]|jgi:hypothetical protein|uniref:Uncharacterized protein n=1 Tax=Flagellimonas marinaquae TaxID=254955 RepID=A0AA48HZT2_9FLAO|nr:MULTISPECIES: hypothetical protein [Allomuricauda]MCA0957925.1 hypothetical protein [Allomuricauda ruestringensis]USD24234.1 hypothetical protein MJO53_11160 [Allomuricauda aquimarina]BDW93106.1 hypothetical protein MACH07_19380 [Allomuricauda aquimarina]
MNNQYCKVGTVTPITGLSQAASVLEVMHNNFIEKAASVSGKDSQLGDFFRNKAQSIKKVLESL